MLLSLTEGFKIINEKIRDILSIFQHPSIFTKRIDSLATDKK